MKKVSVFIDGYNLYHAVANLRNPALKWVNPRLVCKHFIQGDKEVIARVVFFTAPPTHKRKDVQARYAAFVNALRAHDIEIVEGKFKRKILTYTFEGQEHTRITHEEKESDVNLSLAVLEDAYEKASDRLIVITNDSDIAPAIRMARKKNPALRVSVLSPPLPETQKANYDLVAACGHKNRNKKGQTYFKTPMISEYILMQSIMPSEITLDDGTTITMPAEYRRM